MSCCSWVIPCQLMCWLVVAGQGSVARMTTRWGKLCRLHQTPRNCRPSLRIIPRAGGLLNQPWTPISQPRSVGSFCLEPIYLINYVILTTGEPRRQYALPEPDHSTDYQLPFQFACSERICQGRTGENERIIGYKNPPKLRSEPCWTNEGKDENELGTFLIIIYLQ